MATNVKIERDEKTGEIIIRINPAETHGPSASGKTVIVGTTHGAIQLENGIALNVNCYKSNK